MSAAAPAVDVAGLQSQLQEAQAALAAERAAVPESTLQIHVATLAQEGQKVQGRSRSSWMKAKLCRANTWNCRTRRLCRKSN